MNESRFVYVDDPSVALTADGDALVAWVEQARKDVYFQRFDRSGKPRLAQPLDVSRTPATFSWLPRISVAPGSPETIHILWQEIIFSGGSHGGDILFARSTDGGRTFSAPLNLSASRAGDGKGRINRERWHNGSLDIAATRDGNVYAAWTEYEGALWIARSADGGATFMRPRRVAGTMASPARAPCVAVANDGTVYLAWTVGEDHAADVRVARSRDRGEAFEAPVVIAPSPVYSDAPKLAIDAQGVVHLVYAESFGGPFDPSRVYYARSSDGARSFERPRELSRPHPAGMQGASFPSLSVTERGRIAVSWELERRPHVAVALGLTLSADGGNTFATPVEVPGSRSPDEGLNGGLQGLLMRKLATNGAGDVALVNSSIVPNRSSRVWMVRGRLPD